MINISLVAAVDEQLGIGKNQQLLCYLPADLKYFKALTLNKTIIMGRKTFESIGRVLPQRRNIILSTQHISIPGAFVEKSLDAALQSIHGEEEVMIIGGESVFREAILLANHLYITHIHSSFAADVFFPEIDPAIWLRKTSVFRPKDADNIHDLTFIQYERKKV